MKSLFAALLLLVAPLLAAQDMYMVRSQMSFPEAMAVLQETIQGNGYKVSRVQRVDIGLTTFGFETDKYRVVFFGDYDEVHELVDQYPELVPYIPLKIAIFAEGDETILLSSSFKHLRPFYGSASLNRKFDRWEADIEKILEQVRVAQ